MTRRAAHGAGARRQAERLAKKPPEYPGKSPFPRIKDGPAPGIIGPKTANS
jgi:hypothetical protein